MAGGAGDGVVDGDGADGDGADGEGADGEGAAADGAAADGDGIRAGGVGGAASLDGRELAVSALWRAPLKYPETCWLRVATARKP